MRKKLFVVSDIHSFFTPMKKALDEAGFEVGNDEHLLIVCGDSFDRGGESYEVLKFLMTTPNKVLIRGNHEDLLEELCMREYPQSHDFSNGTKRTVDDIGNASSGIPFDECCQRTYAKTTGYRSQLVNYYETKNYIFVHGWIPCEKWDGSSKPWYQWKKSWEYIPTWRDSNEVEWEAARWVNGIKRANDGIIEPGKTIVCGHWHCSYGHYLDNPEKYSEFEDSGTPCWDPYYGDGIIAIDRCTVHTNEVNVLVLEDDLLVEA